MVEAVLDMHRGTAAQQVFYHLPVALTAGQVERGATIVVRVTKVSTLRNQIFIKRKATPHFVNMSMHGLRFTTII